VKKRIGDRRGRGRFEIVGTLTGTLETLRRFKVRNVSAGGALIDTPVAFALHTRIAGRLTFKGQSREIRGEVRHIATVRETGEARRYVAGLEWEPSTRVDDLLSTEALTPAAGSARRNPERRADVRLIAGGDAEIGQPNWATVELIDISTTGVLVASTVQVETGERGELRVRLGERSFAAQIEVKRSDSPKAPHALYRLGAAFVSLDEGSRVHLEDFIGDARL